VGFSDVTRIWLRGKDRRTRPLRVVALALVAALVASACSGDGDSSVLAEPDAEPAGIGSRGETLVAAPSVPTGPMDDDVAAVLDHIVAAWMDNEEPDPERIAELGRSGDPRIGWIMADLILVRPRGHQTISGLRDAFETLTGATIDPPRTWASATDHLIAWDLASNDEYLDWKQRIYTQLEPLWEPFFEDADADVDWRQVAWGGVFLDDRVDGHGTNCERTCIPSLDDPAVVTGVDGDWLRDDRIVFGVVVEGEARAYPRHILEAHEMVNDDLGGRRIGLPYCSLCGSAQAYITDDVPEGIETPVLRTSGLLTRSNKVMFDLVTNSLFDTFTGRAITGPLHDKEFSLTQIPVITSTWGDWKAEHPNTSIVAHDGGVGLAYPLAPLAERDRNGPIFAVGDVDPRLEVMEPVLGATNADGVAVAFPVEAARAALDAGETIEFEGLVVVGEGSGIRAELADGTRLATHQAFWFAWSQFNPDTLVWS